MPLNTFIVRPFGIKKGIDFDQVDRQIIQPALQQLELSGSTTGSITQQGNIRVDVFEKLLTADLVIADVSIHNANVFYELGIRHALREKNTILIKLRNNAYKEMLSDEIPFDLKTDRYMEYDTHDIEGSCVKLANVIKATIATQKKDSPVFQLLPKLTAVNPDDFIALPKDFQEELEQALQDKDRAKLRLLYSEVITFEWAKKALQKIGRAQYKLNDWQAAKKTWTRVRKHDDYNIEANRNLATICQRLGEFTQSDQAIQRVLKSPALNDADRAEIHALTARNMKTRWEQEWKHLEELEKRQQAALESSYLIKARRHYDKGYISDRNHFYSGLNALAMTIVTLRLADKHFEQWVDSFPEDDEANRKIQSLEQLKTDLTSSVKLAIASKKQKLKENNQTDIWAKLSGLDLEFLTSTRTKRVQNSYKNIVKEIDDFAIESIHNQLLLYKGLGVLRENTEAVLEVLNDHPVVLNRDSTNSSESIQPHVILFTGHRVDDESRKIPRFPPSKVNSARKKIAEELMKEQANAGKELLAVAGGASGGDILFHEVCDELGITSVIYLALPMDEYISESIRPANADWVDRFKRLCKKTELIYLSSNETKLPKWLEKKPSYSIWQRSNLWVLYCSLVTSGNDITLIALWNGENDKDVGGTDDMVMRAKDYGASIRHLNTRDL